MAQFDFPSSPTVGQTFDTGMGLVYRWSGVVWNIDPSAAVQLLSQRAVTYNNPGTYAYIPPPNLKFLQVELFGPGGGSGGAAATGASQASAGGGGGGGGYVRKLYRADELSASEALVVGAGGAAGTPTTAGGAGTNSTFKGLVAGGGGGGSQMAVSGVMGATSSRGGAGSAIGGDVNVNGTSGMPGTANAHALGQCIPGYGGACLMSGNLYFPLRLATTVTPNDTTAIGCGGNGGANGASQAAAVNGAAGGPGYAVLTEYYVDGSQAIGSSFTNMRRTVMNASGDYVKPAGLKFVDVELVGTGGNGGLAAITPAGNSVGSGGGGGGGYVRKLWKADELAAIEPVVLGAQSGSSGGSASDSTFKTMTAGGGAGGAAGVVGTSPAQSSPPANGGTATGGDVNIPGEVGERGIRAAHGSATYGQGGRGGSTAISRQGQPFFLASAAGAQQNGIGIGVGGNGSANGGGQAATVSGGFGQLGIAIFTEYF